MSEGDSPPPTTGEEEIDLVLTKDGCKLDKNLKVSPPPQEWDKTFDKPDNTPISTFPFLKTFINLTSIAYQDHITNDGGYWCSVLRFFGMRATPTKNSEEAPGAAESAAGPSQSQGLINSKITGVPADFQFLAEAKGTSSRNGYYGVAYINRKTRQIILSHRGTDPKNLGAVFTDGRSIWWGAYSPQISSAITFAHIVAGFATVTNCQLFFTGHSLGAWLAQITCFSTKYLTSNKERTHFVAKTPDHWDDLHPYTVAFDSPGALQFLLKMKDDLLLRNEPQYQMLVNVSCLPVEVIQFHPNLINAVNTQAGSVYLVDLQNEKMNYSYAYKPTIWGKTVEIKTPLATHSVDPVREMISMNETEEGVLRKHVIDWRVENKDYLLTKWVQEGRSVPVELNRFPEYFLTVKELQVLKKQSDKEVGGCYEGVFLVEEEIANRLVECLRKEGVFKDQYVQLGTDLDRREAIPLVRHFVETLRNGRIWWNPSKPQLPRNHIPRNVYKSSQFNSQGSPLRAVEPTTLSKVDQGFSFLVGPPGAGKSTEMTHQEKLMREIRPGNRIIIRINLNDVQGKLKTISSGILSSILVQLSPFLSPEALKLEGITIVVLLDGFDEVCPTYQATTINLLRKLLTPIEPPTRLLVILTSRPHLKLAIETEFSVEAVTLVPISPDEQSSFIQATLKYSAEKTQQLRCGWPRSLKDLLKNPLMLSMLTDILQSDETFNPSDLDVFKLYSRFVDEKHKLHLLQKERVREEDDCMITRVESTLIRNLPYYYHIAWNELLRGDAWAVQYNELPPVFANSIKSAAKEPPPGPIVTELLKYGLLVEKRETKRLVFKHLSFAEFFYARLLLHSDTPQGVKDTLFGFIYRPNNKLENVEVLVAAVLSKEDTDFRLTPSWILISPHYLRSRPLVNFTRGSLFSFLAKEVVRGFVEEDSRDTWGAFCVLVGTLSGEAFANIVGWMETEVNVEWSRRLLLDIENQWAIALAAAIGVTFESQCLLSKKEVRKATESLERPINIVAALGSGRRDKWDVVFPGSGSTKFRELVLKANSNGLYNIASDVEGVWKLFATFSRKEIFQLVTAQETRGTDLLGENPLLVLMSLGKEFIPRRPHLAQFRAKFIENAGKTVFELGGRKLTLELLSKQLLREMKEGNSSGAVTVAIREAIGRRASWGLAWNLERWMYRRRKCPRREAETVVMDWVVDGGRLWNCLASFPLELLPFVLRHSPSPHVVSKFLQQNRQGVSGVSSYHCLLQSLILSSHTPFFPQLHSFLTMHERSAPPELRSLTHLLLALEEEKLRTVSPPSPFLSDVSVGQVLLAAFPCPIPSDYPLVEVVSNAIRYSPCCTLACTLLPLKSLPQKKLREILLSEDVFFNWRERFLSQGKRKTDFCGLRSLLSFYFSVFGRNLEWMKDGDGYYLQPVLKYVIKSLPVEMAHSLKARGANLLPEFEIGVRKIFSANFNTVNKILQNCFYETEREWEELLRIVGQEAFQPGTHTDFIHPIYTSEVVPLLRVLIRGFGAGEAKRRVAYLWDGIDFFSEVKGETHQLRAELLHCAIQLGQLKEVRRFAFPGLVSWRNPQARNALDIAREHLGEGHPITIHLKKLTELLKGNRASKNYDCKCLIT